MTFGESHKNLSVVLAEGESSCLEAILFPPQMQKAKLAPGFLFISLSLTVAASGGEDSAVSRLGGERPLSHHSYKRGGKSRCVLEGENCRENQRSWISFTGGREGMLNAKLNQC